MRIELPELLPTQEKSLFSKKRNVGFVGGFGSAKTMTLCANALKLSFENSPYPILVIAPSFRMLHFPVISTLVEMLEKNKIDFHHQKTFNVISLPWGDIHFRSADNIGALKGPSVAAVLLEEASEIEEGGWKVAISRARQPNAPNIKRFVSTTPEGFDWIYDLWFEGSEQYGLYQTSTRENFHLPIEYVSDLEEDYSENLIEQYVEGGFVDTRADRCYHEFGSHNVDEVLFNPHLGHLNLTCDFNVKPMCWVLFQFHKKVINVIDEIIIEDNAKTHQAALEFVDKYWECVNQTGGNPLDVDIFGDASMQSRSTTGLSDYLQIQEALKNERIPHTFLVPDANPPVKDRLNSMNAALRDKGGYCQILINEPCKVLRKDLQRVVLNKMGAIDQRRGLSHSSDALGYACYQLIGIKHTRRQQPLVSGSYL